MAVTIIVAHDRNRLIGLDGKIPWHLPEDLKRFKRLTTGNVVVMGRKTWESLPKRPLPDRINIVLSSQSKLLPGAWLCRSLKDALDLSSSLYPDKEVFLIGGEQVYREGLQWADRRLITNVHRQVEVPEKSEASYFPAWSDIKTVQITGVAIPDYTFLEYVR